MSDTEKNSKNKTEPENPAIVNLVPIEANEITIDCRGFDTKVLIDGREIFLEYFKVELDINGHFTNKKTGFRPRVEIGVRARRVRFLQNEDGVKYHGAITEAGIVESDGVFKIQYRSDARDEDEDEDEPTCSCDGMYGTVCGIHD